MTPRVTRESQRVSDLAKQIVAKKKAIEAAEFWDKGPLADDLAALRTQHHLACESLILEADGDESLVDQANNGYDISPASYEP